MPGARAVRIAVAVALLVLVASSACTVDYEPVGVRSVPGVGVEVFLHTCVSGSRRLAITQIDSVVEPSATGTGTGAIGTVPPSLSETSVWVGDVPEDRNSVVVPISLDPDLEHHVRRPDHGELTTTFSPSELDAHLVTYSSYTGNLAVTEEQWATEAERRCDAAGWLGDVVLVLGLGALAASGMVTGAILLLVHLTRGRPAPPTPYAWPPPRPSS